jgi:serine phosphatase RsbU (regulator of sigma subunit)
MDDQGRQFGEVRSSDLLGGYMAAPAQHICEQLLRDVQAFGDPELQQQDDFTIVAIRGIG